MHKPETTFQLPCLNCNIYAFPSVSSFTCQFSEQVTCPSHASSPSIWGAMQRQQETQDTSKGRLLQRDAEKDQEGRSTIPWRIYKVCQGKPDQMVRYGFGSGLGFLGSRERQREKNIPLNVLNVKERGLRKNINGIQTLNRQAILQGSANNCVLWKDHRRFSS